MASDERTHQLNACSRSLSTQSQKPGLLRLVHGDALLPGLFLGLGFLGA
jgi:hypothetical protein